MLIPLRDAEAATCGGKAAGLGAMLRAGLPVPDGFVVPFAVYLAVAHELAQRDPLRGGLAFTAELLRDRSLPRPLLEALGLALGRLGAPAVAVRSSATGEDSRQASAAGQYETTLAVHGLPAVADAVCTCWASLLSPRATAYRSRTGPADFCGEELAMAVIVQRHLDADVSGVMFTPTSSDGATAIDAAWGLGPGVVAGTVTPDTYRVAADGTVTSTVADKRTRLNRIGTHLLTRDVPAEDRRRTTLDEGIVRELAALGAQVVETLRGPQDIEWAVADGRVWLLQARPITVAPPPMGPATSPRSGPVLLTGIPGSTGTATGAARTVRGPDDFARVRPGDILVCPFTDPAWTPLLRLAGGVVTETGGALSHAAIVAREHGIPAVLGLAGALTSIPDGATVTVDGTTGAVTTR
ncbi:PEP/pyruvate-binding domain-containing protein [Blastococcus brunescens]|uniref:PEP/pyruvate-binding domain-containing protein n=1 Tax=Blastococcus brunescens TaxID=1564165 RepID=A0ABZ1B7T0_9ACTN|nr:PEP/pyruvate-binding domain-containing protein [Blastococcus sp. BMG 8361]WRL65933.1 PEP/pyruvate-binding domain-containing protein [Blastococcus sp. BMG 8361]